MNPKLFTSFLIYFDTVNDNIFGDTVAYYSQTSPPGFRVQLLYMLAILITGIRPLQPLRPLPCGHGCHFPGVLSWTQGHCSSQQSCRAPVTGHHSTKTKQTSAWVAKRRVTIGSHSKILVNVTTWLLTRLGEPLDTTFPHLMGSSTCPYSVHWGSCNFVFRISLETTALWKRGSLRVRGPWNGYVQETPGNVSSGVWSDHEGPFGDTSRYVIIESNVTVHGLC